jgi:geranylgeranyl diphosphate synthase type I
MASLRLFGGTRPFTDLSLLRAAASVELFHAFILIHDDVIDRSEVRRGLPTFHKRMEERLGKLPDRARMGQNLAIVVGDMLYALAVDTLLSTDFDPALRDAAMRRFLHYVADTGCGETLDILLSARDVAKVSEEDIVQMYHLKTTRYTFEAPLVLGALLAGADADAIHDLTAVAEPLGLAFQIQNDLVEYSHFDVLDQALQTDLLEGKKTLLIRAAYERLDEVDRSFLQLCLTATPIRDSAVHKIRELVDKSKAVPLLTARREELIAQAERALDGAGFDPARRERFRELVAFIRQLIQAA